MNEITIAEQLKAYMRAKNLTQIQFAKELSIAQSQLNRWLGGKTHPKRAWKELLRIKGIIQ